MSSHIMHYQDGIQILYEDNHLLVVKKPVNMLSQGDKTTDPDLLTVLKADIKERYKKPGNVYLGLVHRLDRPVGGVMVVAKTSKAASRLSEQVRNHEFKKAYLAVVHGMPARAEATLEHYLEKDSGTNTVKAYQEWRQGAKKAILHYSVLKSLEGLSLVKVVPYTGRPHQIRVQFSAIGNPLYGDQKYGGCLNRPGQQIALWSLSIKCIHPTLKKEMAFEHLPPGVYPWDLFDIEAIVKSIRGH